MLTNGVSLWVSIFALCGYSWRSEFVALAPKVAFKLNAACSIGKEDLRSNNALEVGLLLPEIQT